MEYIISTDEENLILEPILDKLENYSEMPLTEKQFLNSLILRNKPKKILELGVSAGGSAAIILNAIKNDPEAFLHSVDYNKEWYKDSSKDSGFLINEQFPEFLKQWSLHTPGLALSYLEQIGGDIDLCLIDTMHANPGEMLDFLMVLPYLKEDAIVIFHDTSLQTWELYQHCYTNCMLFSVIAGDKFMPISSEHQFINIGSIKLNKSAHKNYFDIFNLLLVPWSYDLTNEDYQNLCNFYSKHYPKYCVELFQKARLHYQHILTKSNNTENNTVHQNKTHPENKTYSISQVFPFLRIIQQDNVKKFMLWRFIPIRKVVFDNNKVHKYLFNVKYKTVNIK